MNAYEYRIVCADGECDDTPRPETPTLRTLEGWDEDCECGGPHRVQHHVISPWLDLPRVGQP